MLGGYKRYGLCWLEGVMFSIVWVRDVLFNDCDDGNLSGYKWCLYVLGRLYGNCGKCILKEV